MFLLFPTEVQYITRNSYRKKGCVKNKTFLLGPNDVRVIYGKACLNNTAGKKLSRVALIQVNQRIVVFLK